MNFEIYDPTEADVTLLARKGDFEIWHSGYDPESKEIYVLIIKNGMCVTGTLCLNEHPICSRLSIQSARYIGDNSVYLTKDELDYVVENLKNNWDEIKRYHNYNYDRFYGLEDSGLILYEGVKYFTEEDQLPDYSNLPLLE